RTRLTDMGPPALAYTMFAPDGKRLFGARIDREIVIGSAPWPITPGTAKVIKPQKAGDGELFPTFWSRDGRWLAGPVIMSSGGQRGNALYDLAAGTVRQLSDDAISPDMAWMPDYRRVIYFTTAGKLVVQNIDSLARHEVAVTLPLPPDDLWSL